MQTRDFEFDLPDELIAQQPPARRGDSRLLRLDGASGALEDGRFAALPQWLRAGDVLVFNDTRVFPARLFGRKASGGRVELLAERLLDERRVLAHLRASRSPQPGARLWFDGGFGALVSGRRDDLFEVRFDGEVPVAELFERHGQVPLPPYIRRPDGRHDSADRERYQTVYARHSGAVAAPTAGLHFDEALLQRLRATGVEQTFVTLHVGAGTFQPVRCEQVEQHRMHAEQVTVGADVCARLRAARERGGRVVAVGTTVVRSLEAASQQGELRPFHGDTAIFIYPGYQFRSVDALITNFHLPGSTLLMLVAAFAGRDAVLRAYRHAVERRYRFFSYGDAMFVTPGGQGAPGCPA